MDENTSNNQDSVTIRVLPEELINKIAAGEVVERPASVIKELIENSLDANSKNITIELKDSGKELIKIKDDGNGMTKEDTKLSLLRHATSKIKTDDDLFNIATLGFRGEALASIAAVSKLTIITKKRHSLEGYKIESVGGQIISGGICAATPGTSVEIKDLFWNTPARKKFMKTDYVELRHCIDIVTRYALLHHNISFKLIHDGRMLLHAPATLDQKQNLLSIYGRDLEKELLTVEFMDEEAGVEITGFIAKPLAAKTDKSYQSYFVNNRYVKNQIIQNAVYDAYHSLLFVGRHPVAVLKLNVNPRTIDVNVHPQKTEIKIEQKDLIYAAMLRAVKTALEKNSLVPTGNVESTQIILEANVPKPILPDTPKYQFEKSEQTIFEELESKIKNTDFVVAEANTETSEETTNSEQSSISETTETNEKSKFVLQTDKVVNIESSIKLPEMRILGQIHKTFFIAETPGGMLLIDQHVVQERVLYEKYMQEYLNKHVDVQHLLKPEIVSLTAMQSVTVLKHLDTLKGLGFDLQHFGGNDFSLGTIPTLLGRVQAKDLLHIVIKELAEGKVTELERIQEEIITMMACRASVKAGDVMTIPQITKLLKELSECRLPYTCPHGRAILIKITAEDLEKKFLRHG